MSQFRFVTAAIAGATPEAVRWTVVLYFARYDFVPTHIFPGGGRISIEKRGFRFSLFPVRGFI
ncbi:MAG: hypothetical protein LBF89_05260, partial [Bacteroidales bacterium]|nr:hypothetical protein [Bacteroidales bacterium]